MADPSTQLVTAIGTIADYFLSPTRKEVEVYTKANSPDCFYAAGCLVAGITSAALSTSYARHSTDAAYNDVASQTDSVFLKYKDEVLPEFYSHFATSGAYNSTSLQLLADNAYAKSVAESMRFRIDAVNAYTNARNVDGANSANALGALKGSIHVGSLGASQTTSSVTGLLQAGITLFNGLSGSTGAGASGGGSTGVTNPGPGGGLNALF